MFLYPQGGAPKLQPDNLNAVVSICTSHNSSVDAYKAAVNSLAVRANYFVSLKVNLLDFLVTSKSVFFYFLFIFWQRGLIHQ